MSVEKIRGLLNGVGELLEENAAAMKKAEPAKTVRIIVNSPRGADGLFIEPLPGKSNEEKAKREMEEALNRMMFAQVFNFGSLASFALNPQTVDENGSYNCGACNKQFNNDDCTLIPIDVDLEGGSCRFWEKQRACDRELVVHGTYTAEEAGYGVAKNLAPPLRPGGPKRAFGCSPNCPYSKPAHEADSQGRPFHCGKGDFRVFAYECCALNGNPIKNEFDGNTPVPAS